MCMEDVRIMRRTSTNEKVVTVGLSAVPIVPYNSKRVALVIDGPITNRVTLSFNEGVSDKNGITLEPNGSPIALDLMHHGNIVTREIYGIAVTAPEIICYWESVLNEE